MKSLNFKLPLHKAFPACLCFGLLQSVETSYALKPVCFFFFSQNTGFLIKEEDSNALNEVLTCSITPQHAYYLSVLRKRTFYVPALPLIAQLAYKAVINNLSESKMGCRFTQTLQLTTLKIHFCKRLAVSCLFLLKIINEL